MTSTCRSRRVSSSSSSVPAGAGRPPRCVASPGWRRPAPGASPSATASVFDASRRVNLSPDKRNIGMVFQSYALWPHMTVRKNIAYPLRARKFKEGLQSGWVEETADLVDCGPLLDRYPAQLSGGQQQRVALARGLVARPESGAVRRAVEQPRRASARPGARRDPRAAHPAGVHRRVRDPRSVRSPRPRRSSRGDAPRPHRAVRHAGADLRAAGHRVRGRVLGNGQPVGVPVRRRTMGG